MRRWVPLVVVLAATAALGAWPAAQTPRLRPFTVAVVHDGTSGPALEVVARFTGTAWVHSWGPPLEEGAEVPALEAIPAAWLAGPVPRQWTVWSAGGVTRRVRVTGTRRGDACAAPVLLTIDGPPRPASAVPGTRIAVDTTQPLEALHRSSARDAEWGPLVPVIEEAFRASEPAARAEAGPRAAATVSESALAGQPVAVDFMVRSTDPAGAPVYYFEATRRTQAQPRFGLAVGGWIRRGATGQWTASGTTGRALLEDSNPVPEHEPVAVFRLAGRIYWLVKWLGYEGWSTAIVEVTTTGTRDVLVSPGGGC